MFRPSSGHLQEISLPRIICILLVCFKHQPEDESQRVEIYRWLTYYFYKVVSWTVVLFILQHSGMHTVNRIPGKWLIISAVISNYVNECPENQFRTITMGEQFNARIKPRNIILARMQENLRRGNFHNVRSIINSIAKIRNERTSQFVVCVTSNILISISFESCNMLYVQGPKAVICCTCKGRKMRIRTTFILKFERAHAGYLDNFRNSTCVQTTTIRSCTTDNFT